MVLAKYSLESISLSSKLAAELFTIFTAQLPKIRLREFSDFLPTWLKVAQDFGKTWIELPEELSGPLFSALGAVLSHKQILQEISYADPTLVWFMQWTLRRSRRLLLVNLIDFSLEEPSLYLASRFLMFPDTAIKIGNDLKRLIIEAALEGSERIAKCLSMSVWDLEGLQDLSAKLVSSTTRKDWMTVNSTLAMLPQCCELPNSQSLLHTWFSESRTDFVATLLKANKTLFADDIAAMYRASLYKCREGYDNYKTVVSACVAVLPQLVDTQLKELKQASILNETVFILAANLLCRFDSVNSYRLVQTASHKAGRKALTEHSVLTSLLGKALKLFEQGHRAETYEYARLVGQLALRCDSKAQLRALSRQLKEYPEIGGELRDLVFLKGVPGN